MSKGDCMVCYNKCNFIAPCCKQSFCTECAKNWAEQNQTPSCPGCRKPYARSFNDLIGCLILIDIKKLDTFGKTKNETIKGTLLKICPTIIKVKTQEKTRHIKYRHIVRYKHSDAPDSFYCDTSQQIITRLQPPDLNTIIHQAIYNTDWRPTEFLTHLEEMYYIFENAHMVYGELSILNNNYNIQEINDARTIMLQAYMSIITLIGTQGFTLLEDFLYN